MTGEPRPGEEFEEVLEAEHLEISEISLSFEEAVFLMESAIRDEPLPEGFVETADGRILKISPEGEQGLPGSDR